MSDNIHVSVEISCIRASIGVGNQYKDFFKVMQDSAACFQLFRFKLFFYDNRNLDRAAKHFGRLTPIMQFTRISSICIRVIVRACYARCYPCSNINRPSLQTTFQMLKIADRYLLSLPHTASLSHIA